MAKPSARSTEIALPHSTRLALFGAPPLFDAENSDAYDDMLSRVSNTVNPSNIIEEIWVRDVVDLAWETLRLRRLKAHLIDANMHRGMKVVLEPLCGYAQAEEISAGWARRNDSAVKEVKQLLADAGLTMNEVIAETLAVKISDIERIDRLIMNAEARRNSVMREIDRHRASLGQALRRSSDVVEDAQFTEIEVA